MIKTYFLNVIFHHYFDFKGRATRKQFWAFMFFYVWPLIALGWLLQLLPSVIMYLLIGYVLFTLFPLLALFARRLHDINWRAWWVLCFFFVPTQLFLLVLCLFPTQEPNRF